MGFALWIEPELAWAAGTYEYRAYGAAVISNTDLFRASDFRQERRPPSLTERSFIGYFASLGEVNQYLSVRARPRAVRLARAASNPRPCTSRRHKVD